jgi:hypothetical protein
MPMSICVHVHVHVARVHFRFCVHVGFQKIRYVSPSARLRSYLLALQGFAAPTIIFLRF